MTATVTRTESAAHLFGGLSGRMDVEVRSFDERSLSDRLRGDGVDIVLDATHPFATRITDVARAACVATGVPYVRYERPDWSPPAAVRLAGTFDEAADVLPSLGSRAFLAVGSRPLVHFAGLHDRIVLFARVLPAPLSLSQALEAGFTQERVLGLRPPFTREFNRALFTEYRADVLVTKASGVEGGVVEKVEAALDLGMNVLMVRRPAVGGELDVVTNAADAVAACHTLAYGGRAVGPG